MASNVSTCEKSGETNGEATVVGAPPDAGTAVATTRRPDDVPKFLQFIENQVEVPQHWVCWVTDIITF